MFALATKRRCRDKGQFVLEGTTHDDTHQPELEEILEHRWCNEDTVENGVRQKEKKELVVWETDAVVHPEWVGGEERQKKKKVSLRPAVFSLKMYMGSVNNRLIKEHS